MQIDQQDGVDWKDGVPVARRFDDPYFSLGDGLAETRHVFLGGNDLPARFRNGFHIAELGFGTGLNLLATWQAWRESGQEGVLHYTSFEAFPMGPSDMAKALEAFPELASLSARLVANWTGEAGVMDLDETLRITVIAGDARQSLPMWHGSADAWFLDGFSPAKNPQLWGDDLMRHVARKTAPNGTFATYTAAGHVRRALSSAGFDVQRIPGFGRKRHMSVGTLRSPA